MARHDREESLEEQLAWLDAIKETEEAPVPVTASAAAADEPIASPYPKDPWSLVPQHHDTPTPPLFRAAVDSVYGAEAAEDVPERESEAGEWLGRATVKEEPAAPADDPFHTPLKPLPRPDDTDAYPSLSFTPPEQAAVEPERPEETTWPPSGEETAWVTPPDWPRPATEETGSGPAQETAADEPVRAEEPLRAGEPVGESVRAGEPVRAEEPVRAGEEPAAPAEEKVAWADTQPGNERPSWEEPAAPAAEEPAAADSTQAVARADLPQWAESSETTPRSDRPHWNEPETRGGQEHRLTWSEQQDRSHWNERPSDRPEWTGDRPEWTEERPSWTDQPEDRPQWTEQPEDRPQWTEQAEDRHQQPRPDERRQQPQHADERRQEPEQRTRWTEQPEWRPAEREIPPAPRRRPAPTPVFTAPPRPPVTGRPTAESLDPESLLRGRRNAPSKGWRRLVYRASGGWIKPGEPPEVRRQRELITRARTPVTAGHHRVAVLSLKGGVGKTTTTVGLGATLAAMRGDRVIAVDANPDRGTLSDKLVLETSATVRDLLNERDQVKRYVDIRAFTSQAPSRLEVLASDRDPSVSEAFSGADYQAVSQVLENFYSICITDCGTGLLHSAMGGVLGLADQIVLVSSPSVDGARAASATLDWLEAHHYADLVKNATVVLCSVRPRSKSAVDIKKLEAHFAARCRAVIRVPYDPHLEEGAEIDLDRLQEPTRDAYLQLAACVGDGFAGVRE
ncbi:MinD/ParA family protein [Nonomuraea sp. PA05]|uniref:MinD/ParA family ATP-binding protein n=1 Tax=Nonomuraea sp. PA05 TaxID=2604466 RepID=UPI0021CCC31E|nr:AAA family ATPase [Nonomuraea sp. PA05]